MQIKDKYTKITPKAINAFGDIWRAATPDMSYGMHQYSFSGSVDGIDGNVDLDIAVKDYPDIMRKNRLNGY